MSTIPIHSAERQPCRLQHRHAGALATLTALTIGLAVAGVSALLGVSQAQAQEKRPNIVMLMTDDTGWNDFGAYSNGGAALGHPTPNVDQIAKEGAVFTSWYGQASCTAGRASFITGRIPIRSALSIVVAPGDENMLHKETPTIAEFFKKNGYATYFSGKCYQLRHADLPVNTTPLASAAGVLTNLPVQLTSFVGRDREIASVLDLMRSNRMVTLLGTGGCGKTRLSLRVAEEASPEWPDGIWFVDLTPVEDPALVVQAVAAPMGLREQPGRSLVDTIASSLGGRSALVVMDNCEHVVAAAASVASALLSACPTL